MSNFQKYITENNKLAKLCDAANAWIDEYHESEGGRGSDPHDEELLERASELLDKMSQAIANMS